MSLKDWFKGGTPLQLAIERGLKPGGDLAAELDELDDYTIKSKRDAQAICKAFEVVDQEGTAGKQQSPVYKLAGLFQDVEGGSDACDYLREHGIPLLIKQVQTARSEEGFDQSELLFVLKMLAAYGTKEGADMVIEIARSGYASEKYLWSAVLGVFAAEHPEARRVLASLSNPLPTGFIAVSLLDAANRVWLDGGEMRHPFDSDIGVERLEAFLHESDPELFSYAHSAAVALPFIQHPKQDELFEIAYRHPSRKVRLEAAWAEAKLDRARGLQHLVEMCRDVNCSARAQFYLKELHKETTIPEEVRNPEFAAKAEFSEWLSHPNELGRAPDELEIIDHRDLRWPISGEKKHFWLIRYRAKDETGLAADDVNVGLVGGITVCLFSYKLHQRHPEDAYGIHCYWEMTHPDLITDCDVENSADYESLLQQWNGPQLKEPRIIAVSELEPELSYPRRLVGLAAAELDGQSGWVVLDGPESRWYAREDLPEVAYPKTILMMHIGRRLLGFKEEPNRKSFLSSPETVPAPQIESAYERLLSLAENGMPSGLKRLFSRRGPVHEHFHVYIEAKRKIHGGNKAQYVAATYERLLHISRRVSPSEGLLSLRAVTGLLLEEYAGALVELGREQEVIPLLELFSSIWERNHGCGRLGNAAFMAGRYDLAERFYLQFKETVEDWERTDEMGNLAILWNRQGKTSEARTLILECLGKMLKDGREAEGADRNFFEKIFQEHRSRFLKLFPGEDLSNYGLPNSTLN